ncbi:MAG: signal recognition particle-docking protein FtsY [Acidobacteriota bacterium]|nr:signal recognition particle-docking protein FtsY [Acidobacteriota bacterium]MDH3522214.1 signal recognition particle-docking protein FtsY [Acidobacteriota bacterium]
MSEERLQIAPESAAPERRKSSFWGKLKRGLLMTHTEVFDRVEAAIEGRAVLDEETLEHLEEGLIAADLGVETALELVDELRRDVKQREALDPLRLRERLVDEMALLLLDAPRPAPRRPGPLVTLLVGVNGVGKTTTAAKLARRALADGERVLLAAADTFRAAAVEQLTLWAQRLEVDVVKQGPGADPAAVVFDALQAARARGVDQVIVDTAGRLHTKDHLMAELAKIKRVIDREAAGWQQRRLLVLDATTGQNAVAQAREFVRSVAVDGIILAKLDGTAKGGVAVAIARELRLPIVYLGVGEAADDLVEFRPREFAAALLG